MKVLCLISSSWSPALEGFFNSFLSLYSIAMSCVERRPSGGDLGAGFSFQGLPSSREGRGQQDGGL